MFCPECGAKNQDDAVFCENCGADISQALAQDEPPLQNQIYSNSQPTPETNTPSVSDPQNYVYQSAAAAVAGPKKPMKTVTKVLIGVVLLVVVAIVVLYNVALQMTSSDKIAKDYFETLKTQDWNKAYSYLDITESDFINKANFAAMQKKSNDMSNIVNYSVVSNKTSKSTEKETENALDKIITIQYTTRNSTSPQTMEIRLIKQPAKTFLFFDTWKVSATDYIAPQVTISVPQGAKAFLNGVQIADKYKDSALNDSSSSKSDTADNSTANGSKQWVNYTIKNIFTGTYAFKVTSPYTDDYTKDVVINNEKDPQINVETPLKLKQSILDTVSKQPEEVIKGLYAAALAGKDFDSVKDYFVSDTDTQKNMQSRYEDYLVDSIAKDNKGGFKSITFTNFQPEIANSQTDSGMSVTVNVKFDYSYTAVNGTYDPASPAQEYNSNSTGDMSLTFQLSGDKWLVSNIDGLRLSSSNNNNTYGSFTY